MRLMQPNIVALDSNGAPVSGAKLYIYEAGTSTPVTAYSDAAMTTAHGTITADAAGAFPPIYVPEGNYKIDVQDTNNASLPEYPADNVTLGSIIKDVVTSSYSTPDAAAEAAYSSGKYLTVLHGQTASLVVTASNATSAFTWANNCQTRGSGKISLKWSEAVHEYTGHMIHDGSTRIAHQGHGFGSSASISGTVTYTGSAGDWRAEIPVTSIQPEFQVGGAVKVAITAVSSGQYKSIQDTHEVTSVSASTITIKIRDSRTSLTNAVVTAGTVKGYKSVVRILGGYTGVGTATDREGFLTATERGLSVFEVEGVCFVWAGASGGKEAGMAVHRGAYAFVDDTAAFIGFPRRNAWFIGGDGYVLGADFNDSEGEGLVADRAARVTANRVGLQGNNAAGMICGAQAHITAGEAAVSGSTDGIQTTGGIIDFTKGDLDGIDQRGVYCVGGKIELGTGAGASTVNNCGLYGIDGLDDGYITGTPNMTGNAADSDLPVGILSDGYALWSQTGAETPAVSSLSVNSSNPTLTFRDGGTVYCSLNGNSGNVTLDSYTVARDIIFQAGGVEKSRIDMSVPSMTVDGDTVIKGQSSAVTSPTGGATIDAEARTAIDDIRTVLSDRAITS